MRRALQASTPSFRVRPPAPLAPRRRLLFLSTPQRRQLRLTETVRHPREAVFTVVSDVARYSEFLPFCGVSTVLKHHNDRSFDARLSLGFMAFSENYISHVQVRPALKNAHAPSCMGPNEPDEVPVPLSR